ncbi:MAG: HNH endonuclease [Treponema sp.]|nr:HNH endonuclease [Treponema sp.]
MKKYLCKSPGCSALVDTRGYCTAHQRPPGNPFASAVRSNGALYQSPGWRNLRQAVLREQPTCYRCGIGKDDARLEVHHLVPPRGNEELFYERSNVVAVCQACHRVITQREIGDRRGQF